MMKGGLHLDKRAAQIEAAAVGRDDDELISTKELCAWLGVSVQWAEIARGKGTGPPFCRISPTRIRYRVGCVRAWLRSRTFQSTEDYPAPGRRDKVKGGHRRLMVREDGGARR